MRGLLRIRWEIQCVCVRANWRQNWIKNKCVTRRHKVNAKRVVKKIEKKNILLKSVFWQKRSKMPKIFLIKNRLHQQQLRLLESQNLLSSKDEDRLGSPPLAASPTGAGPPHHHHHQTHLHHIQSDEPLSLVSRKRNKETGKRKGRIKKKTKDS